MEPAELTPAERRRYAELKVDFEDLTAERSITNVSMRTMSSEDDEDSPRSLSSWLKSDDGREFKALRARLRKKTTPSHDAEPC